MTDTTVSDTAVACATQTRAKLGEGCVWDTRGEAVWWTDIQGFELHRYTPATGEAVRWATPERLCCFGLRERGGLVAAFATGFAFYEPETGAIEWIARPEEHLPHNRMNDGGIGPGGRLVAGSMNEFAPEHTGSLWSLAPDGTVTCLDEGYRVSNSICWSPDGRTMYAADSPTREIRAFDYDPATGQASNRRVFATTHQDPGVPDGSAVDADGYLWNAQWDGSRVTRYAPDGSVDRVIPVPVSMPTCPVFGGPDLATLYLTSASGSLDAAGLDAEPWAGSLLAISSPGVRGRPPVRFAG